VGLSVIGHELNHAMQNNLYVNWGASPQKNPNKGEDYFVQELILREQHALGIGQYNRSYYRFHDSFIFEREADFAGDLFIREFIDYFCTLDPQSFGIHVEEGLIYKQKNEVKRCAKDNLILRTWGLYKDEYDDADDNLLVKLEVLHVFCENGGDEIIMNSTIQDKIEAFEDIPELLALFTRNGRKKFYSEIIDDRNKMLEQLHDNYSPINDLAGQHIISAYNNLIKKDRIYYLTALLARAVDEGEISAKAVKAINDNCQRGSEIERREKIDKLTLSFDNFCENRFANYKTNKPRDILTPSSLVKVITSLKNMIAEGIDKKEFDDLLANLKDEEPGQEDKLPIV